jgi:hypothetical protein
VNQQSPLVYRAVQQLPKVVLDERYARTILPTPMVQKVHDEFFLKPCKVIANERNFWPIAQAKLTAR